jgi:cytochrome P450
LRLVKLFAIGGYVLSPGTTVATAPARPSRTWRSMPSPIGTGPSASSTSQAAYALAAFGGGIRGCLGMAFALNLLKGVTATVLIRTLMIVLSHVRPAHQAFFIAPEADASGWRPHSIC